MKSGGWVRIIGIGNRFRSDDGVGLVIAERLRERLGDDEVRISDGDGAALIDLWQGADRVIAINAMRSDRPAGTVARFNALGSPLPSREFLRSTHAIGLPQAIELARHLDRLPRRLLVIGVEIEAAGYGEELSAAVLASVEPVVDQVEHLVGDADWDRLLSTLAD